MTRGEHDAERYRLSPEEHERIFVQRIVPKLTRGLQGSERPEAVILGGQPGAGKSAMQSIAERDLSAYGTVLSVVGDDLRDFHPRYQELLVRDDKMAAFYTDRDSGRWIEKLIAHGASRRYNLVVEGTMRVPEKVGATCAGLRGLGYAVEARVLAVNERLSRLGVHQRYEQLLLDRGHARFTLPEAHDAAYRGMLATLEQIEAGRLASRIAVYARGNVLLFAKEFRAGCWSDLEPARRVVERERRRSLAPQEVATYAAGWEQVWARMQARNAPASDVELVRAHRERALKEVHAGWWAQRAFAEMVGEQTFAATKAIAQLNGRNSCRIR
jgi:hypothetical protein